MSFKKPHPLFDPEYYLKRYPDVARSGQNPLIHFLKHGGLEGRQPHPDFDSAFYLESNPDVLAKKINPLVHFIEQGAGEGRLPHPDFDAEFYCLANPEITQSGMNPVAHFAKFGAARGYITYPRNKTFAPPESYLPVANCISRYVPQRQIDVVIPVFKGAAETRRCVESVLYSSCSASFRVVAINDCSPEQQVTDYLRTLNHDEKITLIENSSNEGFVRSVNAGMLQSPNDVVLLNSDTEVFGNWLDRLSASAYAEEKIGTVTPFSNNATICSYPVFCSDNKIPSFIKLDELDATFAFVNAGRSVDIPTAVGFCMFIRRDCLDETGLFDADAFGLGYGEENDFCMRAAARGWKHRLACDVFVHHTGSVSFQQVSARQKKATETLVARHPLYPLLVRKHVHADPARVSRLAVTAKRIRNSRKRVFLSISHALGGGVAQHLKELRKLTSDEVIWLNLTPSRQGHANLDSMAQGYEFAITFDPTNEYQQLLTVVRACGVERIHIQHLLGNVTYISNLVSDLAVPFDFTFNDHFSICPQLFLTDENGNYCGEPDQKSCDDCIVKRPPGREVVDIVSWRSNHSWLLRAADRVIAPSVESARRIERYCPEAYVIAAEHPAPRSLGDIVVRPLRPDESLRVAVLGTMAMHKGFRLLQECSLRVKIDALPLDFVLIGSTEPALKTADLAYHETGSYEEGDLGSLLDSVAPHLVWFPGKCAETFSLTLSSCLEKGLPVAAHDIGALPERIGGREWSWVVSRDCSPAEWIEFLLQARRDHFLTGSGPSAPTKLERALNDFYPAGYLQNSRTPKRSGCISSKPLQIAAALSTLDYGQIQASGYVRIIEPLTHPALAEEIRLTVMRPEHLTKAAADVVVVQRTAVKDMDLAEGIIRACRNRGIRLVFEIDDDLFHISPEHVEYEHYIETVKPAMRLASSADAIVVSTETLRQRMLDFNSSVVVLPNYLDDRRWVLPSKGSSVSSSMIRALYFGTVSHRDDLDLLIKGVQRLGQIRNRLRIEVIGLDCASIGEECVESIDVPQPVAVSYPRFVEWLQARNHWHWGLAPLLDTEFNRSKSPLKFLQYSALGLASICSQGSVYREVVNHRETGILVNNDSQSWADALAEAVSDREIWEHIRAHSQRVVQENTLLAKIEIIRSAWKKLAKGES